MISEVKIRAFNIFKKIEILDYSNTVIFDSVEEKWQRLLNLIAEIYNVPSALIMKLNQDYIEVFQRSSGELNPYNLKDSERLGSGLYCETVIGEDRALEVEDALDSEIWKDNPDVDLDMTSYYGLPLKWPDGQTFGTICVLDSEEIQLSDVLKKLFFEFKKTVEKDLEMFISYMALEQTKIQEQKNIDLLIEHNKIETLDRFYASLTHEINTPICISKTTASFIDSQISVLLKKHPNIEDEMSTIQEASQMMIASIDKAVDIIMTSKKTMTDVYKEEIESLDLEAYIQSILFSMKYELKRKNVFYRIESDLKKSIRTIPCLFSQVLLNLISNSLKQAFSNDVEHVIDIEIKDLGERVAIVYYDIGVGIDETISHELFEPFLKSTKITKGSGMGLAISKEIVEKKLNGQISKLDVKIGSCFEILLPKEF